MYGGFEIKSPRIVFPNGSIDPWHALGIIDDSTISSDSLPLYINGTAHCSDLYPDSDDDPPQLTQARLRIKNFLASALREYK